MQQSWRLISTLALRNEQTPGKLQLQKQANEAGEEGDSVFAGLSATPEVKH